MVKGTLIAESLRVGVEIAEVPLRVLKIWRGEVGSAAGGQSTIWTVMDFEAEDRDAEALADVLADSLDPLGAWYVDFATAADVFVVFAGKVFRYRRGYAAGRAEAAAYAVSIGVPSEQLDWAE